MPIAGATGQALGLVSSVKFRGRAADKQPEGPTAVSGDQASDLHLLGSGGASMTEPEDSPSPAPKVQTGSVLPGLGCPGCPIREVLCLAVIADPAHILPYK
jgi:hypothetical protein